MRMNHRAVGGGERGSAVEALTTEVARHGLVAIARQPGGAIRAITAGAATHHDGIAGSEPLHTFTYGLHNSRSLVAQHDGQWRKPPGVRMKVGMTDARG